MTTTTELARAERPTRELAHAGDGMDFSRAKVELLKRTICKGSTDDELELFVHACKRTGLDPFMRQINAVQRYQDGQKVMTIQTGIDGFRLIADRTGKYMPGPEPTYVYDDSNRLVSATAHVRKLGPDGKWHDISATAFFEEYAGYKSDRNGGGLTKMWVEKPHVMTAKCAEALALRKAFPADLSGVYTDEEMARADQRAAKDDGPDLSKDEDFYFVWDAAVEGKGLDRGTGRKLLYAICRKRGLNINAADAPTRHGLVDELKAKTPADMEKLRRATNGTAVSPRPAAPVGGTDKAPLAQDAEDNQSDADSPPTGPGATAAPAPASGELLITGEPSDRQVHELNRQREESEIDTSGADAEPPEIFNEGTPSVIDPWLEETRALAFAKNPDEEAFHRAMVHFIKGFKRTRVTDLTGKERKEIRNAIEETRGWFAYLAGKK